MDHTIQEARPDVQLLGKRLADITPDDIQQLLDNKVAESRRLDYKLTLPGNSDADKREFLADVSAFANTDGGVIAFGLRAAGGNDENAGLPEEVVGVSGASIDKFGLWVSQLLRDGLSPRITSHELREVVVPRDGQPDARVFLLGIPQSVVGPHGVWFQKLGRFYRRSEADKYMADVDELRRMFLRTSSSRTELDALRRERLDQLESGPPLAHIDGRYGVLIHALPVGRLDTRVDIRAHERRLRTTVPPPFAGSWDHRYNSDGFMLFPSAERDGKIRSYVQWFFHGGLEVFTDRFHRARSEHAAQATDDFLAATMGGWMRRYVPEAVRFIEHDLDVSGPFAVMVSIKAARNRRIVDVPFMFNAGLVTDPRFDREPLLPPVALAEDADHVGPALDEVIDAVWQAAGFPGGPR